MAMIFLDESGHFSESDFVCLAGYVASDSNWDGLCKEWKELLGKHGIPAVHMREIMSPKGKSPAASWKDEDKVRMIREFIFVIRKYIHTGFGVGLEARYYRELVKVAAEEARRQGVKTKPFHSQLFCVARMCRLIMNYFKEIGSEEQLSLIFDDSPEYSMKCYSFVSKLKQRQSDVRRTVSSLTFADDSVFYPLQAADILAYATCNELKKGVNAWSDTNMFTDLFRAEDPGYGLPYRSELWSEADSETLLNAIIQELVSPG